MTFEEAAKKLAVFAIENKWEFRLRAHTDGSRRAVAIRSYAGHVVVQEGAGKSAVYAARNWKGERQFSEDLEAAAEFAGKGVTDD